MSARNRVRCMYHEDCFANSNAINEEPANMCRLLNETGFKGDCPFYKKKASLKDNGTMWMWREPYDRRI